MKNVVLLVDVVKAYKGIEVVKNIDLSIKQGEFFSLLGPSGCGKTTTLRLIGGFEQPTSGSVLIDGSIVNGLPPYKRRVNTVFQNYALFPHMNVFENIAFGLIQKNVPKNIIKKKVSDMLDLVKLQGFENRRINKMSGGQQQRIALARALVNEPQVLLLDEPLSALDQKLRKNMQVELKRIQKHLKITFILVTHDQEEALIMSDRIAVMNEGRIEQVGKPHEIYESPKTRFVADFIGEANFLKVSVLEITNDFILLNLGNDILKVRKNGVTCTAGESIEISIRPERFKISKYKENMTENVLKGLISSIHFLGDITRYEIMLEGNLPVLVSQQNIFNFQNPQTLRVGESIFLHCSPDSMRLVKT